MKSQSNKVSSFVASKTGGNFKGSKLAIKNLEERGLSEKKL